MKQATQKQLENFSKRFDKFYKECAEQGYIPVPALGMNQRSIYAYINVIGISKKEIEDIFKKIK